MKNSSDFDDDDGRGVSAAALIGLVLIIAVFFYALSLVRHASAEPGDKYELLRQQRHDHTPVPLMTAAAGHIPALQQTGPVVVGGRPAQCPRRYCGCKLSIDLFGWPDPKLFPAVNWLQFQRVAPQPGMVAARKGHVMRLLAHVRGLQWQVLDPNSGKGLTRIHTRSIAGFVIVNPHSRRA